MFNLKDAVTPIEFAAQIPDLVQSAKSGSLIEYTRATRVEPVTLVDMRAAQLPYIDEVMGAALNVFAAYYLQAVSLSVNVGNVNVLRLLDKLNPNRDVSRAAGQAAGDFANYITQESFENGLPFIGMNQSPYSQESQDYDTTATLKDSIKLVNDSANLSVGKLLEVTVESGPQRATFPVQVRLAANTIRPDVLAHTLAMDSKDTSLKGRYHGWRSGQLEFFKDIILCQDLIDEHRKNLMRDTTGYYKERVNARKNNRIAALLTRQPSVATASSIYIMTSETARELEMKMRGRLKDFKTREKLFADTMGMLLFVIDPDWENITLYSRSIATVGELSVKEIQRSGKGGKGPDIMPILEAFMKQKSPF